MNKGTLKKHLQPAFFKCPLKHNPKFAIRYSLRNVTHDDKILNIPLYAIWNTENYIKSENMKNEK